MVENFSLSMVFLPIIRPIGPQICCFMLTFFYILVKVIGNVTMQVVKVGYLCQQRIVC